MTRTGDVGEKIRYFVIVDNKIAAASSSLLPRQIPKFIANFVFFVDFYRLFLARVLQSISHSPRSHPPVLTSVVPFRDFLYCSPDRRMFWDTKYECLEDIPIQGTRCDHLVIVYRYPPNNAQIDIEIQSAVFVQGGQTTHVTSVISARFGVEEVKQPYILHKRPTGCIR